MIDTMKKRYALAERLRSLASVLTYNADTKQAALKHSLYEIVSELRSLKDFSHPNRHPYADVIHAYAEGAEVEFKPSSADLWTPVPRPCFDPALQYRVKLSSPQLPLPLDEQTDDAGGVCTVC